MGAEHGSEDRLLHLTKPRFGKVWGLVLDKQGNKDSHCDAVDKKFD